MWRDTHLSKAALRAMSVGPARNMVRVTERQQREHKKDSSWLESRIRIVSAVNKPKTPVLLVYEQEPKQSQFNGLSNWWANLKSKGLGLWPNGQVSLAEHWFLEF